MNDFDKIIKQKLENYQETPPPEVLEKVKEFYPKQSLTTKSNNLKYFVTAGIIILAIVTSLIIINQKDKTDNKTSYINTSNVVTENKTLDAVCDNSQKTESDQTLNFKSSSPISKSNIETNVSIPQTQANKFGEYNIMKDTIICGNEIILNGVTKELVAPIPELTLEQTVSGVKIYSSNYGTHQITVGGEFMQKVNIKFIKPEIPEIKLSAENLCSGENLYVTIQNIQSDILWNDQNYNVYKVEKSKYKISNLKDGNNSIIISTNDKFCPLRIEKKVSVTPQIIYSISSTPNYCKQKSAKLVVSSTNSKINYCQINNNQISTDGIFENLNSGTYNIKINYNNSCTEYDTISIKDLIDIDAYFISSQNAFNDKKYDFRNNTKIDDKSINQTQNISFKWFVNGELKSNDYNFEFEFTSKGIYTVELKVYLDGNCINSYSEAIHISKTEFKIPNVFTPNGDGISDEFMVFYDGELISYKISIFNQSGELLFESKNINEHWNGKINGNNDAFDGIYFYIITATNENNEVINEKGTLQLIRR